MSALQKWFVKLKTILRRTMTKIRAKRMDPTDQKKNVLIESKLLSFGLTPCGWPTVPLQLSAKACPNN